jgi:hypothetical protein
MANLSKLKRPNSLGAPPPLEEASRNLKASEIAPSAAVPQEATIAPLQKPGTAARPVERQPREPRRLDARSLRKSGRLIPFATRSASNLTTVSAKSRSVTGCC